METLPVPLEVMVKIFTACASETTRLHPNAAPILLTRVCREWRTVALSTPELWTELCVSPVILRSEPVALALKTYLASSNPLPAKLSLTAATDDERLVEDDFVQYTLPVARDSTNLTSLDISVLKIGSTHQQASPPATMTTSLPVPLPHLSTLRIDTEYFTSIARMIALLSVPNLTSLHLIRTNPAWSIRDQQYVSTFLTLIATVAPTLHTLELGFQLSWLSQALQLTLIDLHALTSLTLHEVSYTSPEFMQKLTLTFSPDDESLVSGQNTGLKRLVLDMSHEVTDAKWSDPEMYEMYMKQFFPAVVEMVLSRTKRLPRAAIDSGAARPLEFFGIGPHFAQAFRGEMESRWDEVKRGWADLEGVVNFVERYTDCECF